MHTAQRQESPRLSVVIPVYNGRDALPPLLVRLAAALRALTPQFEVILVNDGSADGSWEAIVGLCAQHAWLGAISLERNIGQQGATLAGLAQARGLLLLTMDDDLQHPPEAIAAMMAAMGEGVDVVYAAPRARFSGRSYAMFSCLVKYALTLLGVRLARHMRSFRLMRAGVVDWRAQALVPQVSVDGLLARSRPRVVSVRVDYGERITGQSAYSLARVVTLTLNIWRAAHGLTPRRPRDAVKIAAAAGWLARPQPGCPATAPG